MKNIYTLGAKNVIWDVVCAQPTSACVPGFSGVDRMPFALGVFPPSPQASLLARAVSSLGAVAEIPCADTPRGLALHASSVPSCRAARCSLGE